MEGKCRVSSILIYPIKSCSGISVTEAPLTPNGFLWDRNWIVVNNKGRFRSQRNEPKLALVQVSLPLEAFVEGWEPTNHSYMVVKAPGMGELRVPLAKPQEISENISIWEWCGSALDEGAEPAKWFSCYLGKPCRLVRFNSGSEIRPVAGDYAPEHNVFFTDFGPYMIASQGSLDELNKHLEEPVSINRFRPSIVVDGCEPFSEDLWQEIRIDKFRFEGVKLCARCKIPNINQETGVGGSEPNATLNKIHSDKTLRPNKKQKGEVYFGHYVIWKDNNMKGEKGNIIKVGAPLSVLKIFSSAEDAAI